MHNYVAKGLNVSCRTIIGEAYIYNHKTRLLIKLDEVGSFIWDRIDGMKSICQISELCGQVFEGDKEYIELAVNEFIIDLNNKDVAVLSNEPFTEEMISVC